MLRSSLSAFLRLGTHLSAVLAWAEFFQLHNCYLSWDLSSSIFIFIFFQLDLISYLAGKIRWVLQQHTGLSLWWLCRSEPKSLSLPTFFSPSVVQKIPGLWEAALSCHRRPSWRTWCFSSQSHTWQHKCQLTHSFHMGHDARGKTWGRKIGSSTQENQPEILRCKKKFFLKMKFLRWPDFISLDWTSWVCSKLKKKNKNEGSGILGNSGMKYMALFQAS